MNLLDLISGAGNLLDLPGSSVRDLLSGRNPFDQWTTPFSSDNRASGRDMLSPILGANKETGMSGWLSDPMEGLKDIAGFGAEVITDPMNLIPAGWFGKVLGSRKATQAANAAVKAERGGKYSFVNPKLLARTADDAVKPVVQAVSDQNPMKLLGYTPPPETVYHGGWDWSASATPEHPYGMFDISRTGGGEGNQAFGPGAYFADDAATTKRYRNIVQKRMDESVQIDPEMLRKYYTPGNVIEGYGGMFEVTKYSPGDGVNSGAVYARKVEPVPGGGWTPSQGLDGRERIKPANATASQVYAALGIPRQQAKTYTLDMPAGSKDRFLSWDNPVMDQPPHVVREWEKRTGKSADEIKMQFGSVQSARHRYDVAVREEKDMLDGLVQSGLVPDSHSAWEAVWKDPSTAVFQSQEASAVARDMPILRKRYSDIQDNIKTQFEAYQKSAEEAAGRLGLHPNEMLNGNPSIKFGGNKVAGDLIGMHPADATIDEVLPLTQAGIPGTKNRASSTNGSSYNYAIWDKDLLNRMRIRAIDGQRVPINPTTLVQRVEQPFQRAAVADSQLMSNMNPMNLQRPQTAANPVALALLQNLLSRSNNWAGGNQ